MKTRLSARSETGLAASVAPEDLCCGDYVAILSVIYEYPSFLWCWDSARLSPDEPVRVECTDGHTGTPLKIKAICLPFVFVKDPAGKHRALDIRLCRLGRLSRKFARHVWKTLRRKAQQQDVK